MKRLLPILLVGLILVVVIPTVGCTPSEPKPFPPPEGYSSWDEYNNRNQTQAETPSPTPYEETETYTKTVPLSYEVVESYTDTDSYTERRRIVIGGEVFQDEVVEVFYPVCSVTLQNTDDVDGVFEVQFTFYALDKLDAGTLGGHPDFDFEDYIEAEDPDDYLDDLDWDDVNWNKIMIFCDEYDRQEDITLQPNETGTVTASAQDIDIDNMAWKWEYEITEPTKEVEK